MKEGEEPGLAMRGHSGCEVRRVVRDGHVFVEKASCDPRYNGRLARQFQKQRAASESNRLRFVRIPRILEEGERDGLTTARMEYVYFLSSIDFFSTASVVEVDAVVDMLAGFIDAEVADSEMVDVPPALFADKIRDVAAALEGAGRLGPYEPHVRAMQDAVAAVGAFRLPVGRCHGDLTFSNVMIASDSRAVALIDFLDSFLESPIIDLAKIRQDSRFCWSLMMAAGEVDPPRFRMVMRYVDAQIASRFSGSGWYEGHIDLVLALNMLRIAPYARSEDVHKFLLDAISSLELRR